MKLLTTRNQAMSSWESCVCGNLCEMKTICKGRWTGADEYDYRVEQVYKVLRCPSCGAVSIYRYTTGWADCDLDCPEPGPDYHEYERELLYCSHRRRDGAIPSAIAEILDGAESVQACPRAVLILCRAVLEEICRERLTLDVASQTLVKGSTAERHRRSRPDLYAKLKRLAEQDGLPPELCKVIDGIRILGNLGAHDSQAEFGRHISSEDAATLLALTNHVVDQLYVQGARQQRAAEAVKRLRAKVDKGDGT